MDRNFHTKTKTDFVLRQSLAHSKGQENRSSGDNSRSRRLDSDMGCASMAKQQKRPKDVGKKQRQRLLAERFARRGATTVTLRDCGGAWDVQFRSDVHINQAVMIP